MTNRPVVRCQEEESQSQIIHNHTISQITMTNHKSQITITNHTQSHIITMTNHPVVRCPEEELPELGDKLVSNWEEQRNATTYRTEIRLVPNQGLNFENEEKVCSYKFPSYRCRDEWKRFQANGSNIFTRDVVVTCRANKTWSRSSIDIPCKSEFQLDFLVLLLRFLLPLSP